MPWERMKDRRLCKPFGNELRTNRHSGIEIFHIPSDYDYHRAIAKLSNCEIDFLIHPSTSSLNAPFKTINALINAVAIESTLVASNASPFSEYYHTGAFAIAEDTVQDWHRVLQSLLQHENKNKVIQETANRFCKEHFAGTKNQNAIDSLLQNCSFVDSVEIDRRWRSLNEYHHDVIHKQKELKKKRFPLTQSYLKKIGHRIEKRCIRPVLKSAKNLIYNK